MANLLLSIVRSRVKRKWALPDIVSVVRQMLMSHINIFKSMEGPEGSWREIIKRKEGLYPSATPPKGNPGLQPEYTNSFKPNFNWFIEESNLLASFYYRNTLI